MARPGEKADQQPIYGAAVPLAKPIKLDREKVHEVLRALVSEAGARVRMIDDVAGKRGILSGLRSKPTEITCEIAGVRLMIRAASRPLCSASTMHSFINPSIWRGGLGGMTGHRAHLLIAEADAGGGGSNSRDAMFDRATAVTLATAAIADMAESEAEGVIWLPARNAVPMGTFGSEMERFIDGQAPLQFWLRWQVLTPPVQAEYELGELSGEALHPGVATVGMTAFIGSEIIAPPSNCERDVMLDHVFALASAMIDENAELKDGAVYGKAGGILVRLNMRKSGPHSDRPYWELLPRPAPASKGRPLFDAGDGASDDADIQPESRLRLVTPGR
ncbi:MAG: hypothetical protein ACTSVG_05045 [Alphaproteobacteria bacterium]